MEFKTVHKEKILNSPFQRQLSEGLVKRLKTSITTCGFLVPLILVRIDEQLAGKLGLKEVPEELYLLVDGQHRFNAGLQLGMTEFPSFIVDKAILNFPLHLNTEKSDNIKDKATKIYQLYLQASKFAPGVSETDAFKETLNQDGAYVLPIAFAYKEKGLRSPSLIEDFAKKVFHFTDLPLKEAIQQRRKEADLLVALESAVNTAAEQYGIGDFILKKSILAIAMKDCYGEQHGKRVLVAISDDPQTAVTKIMTSIASTDWSFLTKKEALA